MPVVRRMPPEMAGAPASPTGTGAGAMGSRKFTVTGGGFSVTLHFVTPVVGVANKEGILSSRNVGSPRKFSNDGYL